MRPLYLILSLLLLSGCEKIEPPTYTGENRTFESSFESVSDFDGFYIVPDGDYDSTHSLVTTAPYHGTYAHQATILRARDTDNDSTPTYLPHRAYPTIQFQKTANGIYRTPALVTLWVKLDMTLTDMPTGQIDDWFSFVTLCADSSDNWTRTVLVNIVHDGFARLVHVPYQGDQEYIYQTTNNADKFPFNEWVRLDIYIDFDATSGYAKVWQNGTLISHANVRGGAEGLAQAHFGLYAGARSSSGTIYNDRLRIKEVDSEAQALELVNSVY